MFKLTPISIVLVSCLLVTMRVYPMDTHVQDNASPIETPAVAETRLKSAFAGVVTAIVAFPLARTFASFIFPVTITRTLKKTTVSGNGSIVLCSSLALATACGVFAHRTASGYYAHPDREITLHSITTQGTQESGDIADQ